MILSEYFWTGFCGKGLRLSPTWEVSISQDKVCRFVKVMIRIAKGRLVYTDGGGEMIDIWLVIGHKQGFKFDPFRNVERL